MVATVAACATTRPGDLSRLTAWRSSLEGVIDMVMAATAERTLRVWDGRLQMHVKVAGSGPPVVYFHAAGGAHWDGFLNNLAERYTVYAPEHPGTSVGDPNA